MTIVWARPFDDRGLADAGLADEHGVVLGAPREHLHHALESSLRPITGIELSLAASRGEVAAELIEDERCAPSSASCADAGAGGWPPLLLTGGPGSPDSSWMTCWRTRCRSAPSFTSTCAATPSPSRIRPEQDVLGADVVVAELQCLAQRQLENLLGAGSERDVADWGLPPWPMISSTWLAHGFERDAERLERFGRDALALVDQAEQDVLGPDVVVVEHSRLFLGENDHTAGPVGKPLEHLATPHRS